MSQAMLTLLGGGLGLVLWALPARGADTRPPVVQHVPVSKAVRDSTVTIQATMTDEMALFAPTLYYRTPGTGEYASLRMQHRSDQCMASLKITGNLEYWIEVYDEVGNGPTRVGTPEKPLLVTVVESAEALSEAVVAVVPPPALPIPATPAPTPGPPPPPVLSWPDVSTIPVEPPAPVPAPARTVTILPSSGLDETPMVPAPRPLTPHVETTATPLYRDAWFMGGLSVMAVGTIVAVVLLATPEPIYRNVFDVTVTAPGAR
jgi:hypothetical protein